MGDFFLKSDTVQRSTRSKDQLRGSRKIKRSKINLFHGSTDQRSPKIKDQQDQRSRKSIEINYFQITDQKFKVQLFTDQITNSVLAHRKPGLFVLRQEVQPLFIFYTYISIQILSSTSILALLSPDCHFKLTIVWRADPSY